MPVNNAREKINSAMMDCEGITSGIHRFGGVEYRLGKREIGHVHGNYLVDIPFPLKARNEIVEQGLAEKHHILPDSGWVSVFLKSGDDVDRAIELLKGSYGLALEQREKRNKVEI